MKFYEFVEEIKTNIFDYLPQEYQDAEIQIGKVMKNNGLELTALSLKGNENMCPNIYLEPYFEQWQRGITMENSLRNISEDYLRAMENMPEFSAEMFTYENIKDKLYVTLVNAEKNEEMLSDMPHRNYEDLATVYRVQLTVQDASGSFAVNNSHLKMFGVDIETLHEQAMKNMKQILPYTFQGMNEVMAEMFGASEEEFIGLDVEDDLMWVLSNDQKMQGAAYMLDDAILRDISEKLNSNLIIIPSSIHELIVLREDEDMDLDGLKDMVADINATQVKPEEVLSDSVYRYDAKEQALSRVEAASQTHGMKFWM